MACTRGSEHHTATAQVGYHSAICGLVTSNGSGSGAAFFVNDRSVSIYDIAGLRSKPHTAVARVYGDFR